jgi:tetratricopeptide (TPR) repeat protein
MVAGNYKEAYDYCNKALEIDPQSAALWENKAISCFWIRTDSDIIETEAKEILTYLNAAKQADTDSETYEDTASSIASNLFYAVYYRYLMVTPDVASNGKDLDRYSFDASKKILSYIKIMGLCFDIYPVSFYLEEAVKELTNLTKLHWIDFDNNGNKVTHDFWKTYFSFDAVRTRDRYISKLTKLNSNYIAPEFAKKRKSGWRWYHWLLLLWLCGALYQFLLWVSQL